jgi:hypothetical protein
LEKWVRFYEDYIKSICPEKVEIYTTEPDSVELYGALQTEYPCREVCIKQLKGYLKWVQGN